MPYSSEFKNKGNFDLIRLYKTLSLQDNPFFEEIDKDSEYDYLARVKSRDWYFQGLVVRFSLFAKNREVDHLKLEVKTSKKYESSIISRYKPSNASICIHSDGTISSNPLNSRFYELSEIFRAVCHREKFNSYYLNR
jgi:hypothetical protein